MSSLKLGLTACFVSNLSFPTLQDLLTNHVRPSAVVLALARHDPSSCGSSPMGRKRRAAGGDTVAHEDRTGHIPDHTMGHGLAMRMVLQAMVAGTGTTAAMPQRSSGDGRQGETWLCRMGKLVEHQNTDTPRGMGGSGSESSRNTLGHWGQSGHTGEEDKHIYTDGRSKRRKKNERGTKAHRKGLVGLPITVGQKEPMVGKFSKPGSAGSDGSCSESDTSVKSQPTMDREVTDGRGSLKKVLSRELGVNEWKVKSKAFCKKFLALNTALSRNSKRRQMVTVLKQIKSEPVLPVNQEELTVAASVLDEARLVSADQYLHEIKLMQVETGGPWDMSMERQLVLCKKALNRHKGPEKRAIEVKVENFSRAVWEIRSSKQKEVKSPALAYAWATVWMLRAAEVVVVKIGHVSISHSPRTVSLFIPRSKTDQRERGVSRTLRCSCTADCEAFCAWGLALKLLASLETNDPTKFLFPDNRGFKVKKATLVRAWQKHLNSKMSGHSARRSGAMGHARRGTSVANISFLGRWKSSAVFRYVEEALQFVPSNDNKISYENCVSKNEDNYQAVGSEVKFLEGITKEVAKEAEDPKQKVVQPKSSVKITQEVKIEEADELFAIAPGRNRTRMVHWVSKAAWGADLDSWATACGWKFARRCEKVQLAVKAPGRAQRCQKCESIRRLRDDVKGGATLAQMLAKTFGANSSTK